MPRHRPVPTLQAMSLRAIGALVVALVPPITTEPPWNELKKIESCVNQHINKVKQFLASNIPFCLYDATASEILLCVKNQMEENEKLSIPNLIEAIASSNLKHLDFEEWPVLMQDCLYKSLWKMTGLETLNLSKPVRPPNYKEYFVKASICGLKHLQSFACSGDCSDELIQAISDNCPRIQCIDVKLGSVSDCSIPALLKCTQLRKLKLGSTRVSVSGWARILRGLAKLEDIGPYNYFQKVLDTLYKRGEFGPFSLRRINTGYLHVDQKNLQLLVNMFPKVESLRFHIQSNAKSLGDWTIFASFDCLQELHLDSEYKYEDTSKRFLELRGSNITNLNLTYVKEFGSNFLIDVGQFCPRLKTLSIHRYFIQGEPIDYNIVEWDAPPFQSLEGLYWGDELNHLEFILNHAVNIRSLTITGCGYRKVMHPWLAEILNVNTMLHLEQLSIFSGDLNMRTVEMLLERCGNLRSLSNLRRWEGVTEDEFKTLKQYIRSNNFNLSLYTHDIF